MKINHDLRMNVDLQAKGQQPLVNDQNLFGDLVSRQGQKLQSEQLARLMDEIALAGSRVDRSRNLRDLTKFKSLVRRFIKESADYGMNLKQSKSWNQYGEGKTLQTVETIDQKLMELTNALMDNENKSIQILKKIGEIKGLLINLYM
ncbi:DUF327 family protein [Jeotgalibacillus sp. S-D1]|uniref:YaaR family protein n=1 Tax=Jeotgalibacillus sp. S-D1 TaxID=2552189 RepID=UPI0010597D82|nr:YaaR family protein [Jeotgalibacillus sp. S-D1]TDL30444.1 DUF327 family protein [Jeotgalibacillus sp. S-D1]